MLECLSGLQISLVNQTTFLNKYYSGESGLVHETISNGSGVAGQASTQLEISLM